MSDNRETISIVRPDGIVLNARVAGPESAPTVLLLHGLGEDLQTFWERGWVDVLTPSFRVLAFDARGHGASSRPHAPARYDASERVGDALAVLDATSTRCAHVVGYSMGAWTAMLLVAAAPERVSSLAIGGASPTGQPLEPLRRLIAAGLPALRAVVERECGPLSESVTARLMRNDRAALAALCAMDRPDLSAQLARFRGPVVTYVGGHDPLRPLVEGGAHALGWPCVVLPRAGHFQVALGALALPLVADHLAQSRARVA